jgi:DNA primase
MEAKDPKAKALQKYLTKERGYTAEDIEDMKLGCITSQEALRKYLKDKGYTNTDIEQIKLHEAIGNTHTLTIPLREPGGKLRGISVRTISDAQPKYLYSTGLIKADLLFNLRAITGKKDLVIVEGLLDALLCSAKGIENVVALGSKTLNKAQLETAVKYGAQKITLCLDNEEQTIPNILNAIKLIQEEKPELKIFVAQLPEGVKDPDELIRKERAEAFKKVIAEAIPYYKYLLKQIRKKYVKIQEEQGSLSDKDEEDFIQEILVVRDSHRYHFLKCLSSLFPYELIRIFHSLRQLSYKYF